MLKGFQGVTHETSGAVFTVMTTCATGGLKLLLEMLKALKGC